MLVTVPIIVPGLVRCSGSIETVDMSPRAASFAALRADSWDALAGQAPAYIGSSQSHDDCSGHTGKVKGGLAGVFGSYFGTSLRGSLLPP